MTKKNNFSSIYGNFQELLKANHGIFKLFKKTKNPGILEAIWTAREEEVLNYRSLLEAAYTRLAYFKEVINLDTLEKKDLKSFIQDLQNQIIHQRNEKNKYKEKCLRYKGLNQNLDRANQLGQHKLIQKENDQNFFKEHLELSQTGLKEMDDIINNQNSMILDLENELKAAKIKVLELEDHFKSEKQKVKQYQKMNKNMENELYRLQQ